LVLPQQKYSAARTFAARILLACGDLSLLFAAAIFVCGWLTIFGRRFGILADVFPVSLALFVAARLLGGKDLVLSSLGNRLFLACFDKLTAIAARRPALLVGCFALVYAALWTAIGAQRYLNWYADISDIGIPYQSLWNTLHGKFYFSSIKANINLFHDHVEPFYFVFLPLVALFRSPLALVVAQNVVLPFAALILLKLAMAKTDYAGYRWVVPLSYLAYVPLHGIMNFDYHALAFVIPLLFAALLYLERGRFWPFFGFALLAMTCKETVPLTLAAFGVALAVCDSRNRKWGWTLAAFAAAVAVLEFKALPHLLHYKYTYASLYSHLGPTTWQILLSPLLRPRAFWGGIFNVHVADFSWRVLAPALFLPLVYPPAAAPILFLFAELVLPAGNQKMSYVHHYVSEIIPFLYYGAICALPRAEEFLAKRLRVDRAAAQRRLALAILAATVFFYGKPEANYLRAHAAPADPDVALLQTLLPRLIPPDAGVAANDCIMNHLLNRRYVYSIRHLPEFANYIDYVIYDRKLCPINLEQQGWESEEDIVCGLPYHPIYQTDRLIIYRRDAPGEPASEQGTGNSEP
jgi:uncharacterized membrane protein